MIATWGLGSKLALGTDQSFLSQALSALAPGLGYLGAFIWTALGSSSGVGLVMVEPPLCGGGPSWYDWGSAGRSPEQGLRGCLQRVRLMGQLKEVLVWESSEEEGVSPPDMWGT